MTNRPEEFETKEKPVDNVASGALANIYNEVNADRKSQSPVSDNLTLPKITLEDSGKHAQDSGNKLPTLSNILKDSRDLSKNSLAEASPQHPQSQLKQLLNGKELRENSSKETKDAPSSHLNKIKELLTNPAVQTPRSEIGEKLNSSPSESPKDGKQRPNEIQKPISPINENKTSIDGKTPAQIEFQKNGSNPSTEANLLKPEPRIGNKFNADQSPAQISDSAKPERRVGKISGIEETPSQKSDAIKPGRRNGTESGSESRADHDPLPKLTIERDASPESKDANSKIEKKEEAASSSEDKTEEEKLKEEELKLAEEDRKEEEAARESMRLATELAKEHLQAAEDMLKKGDYAGLMKLAAELEDKKNNGSLALASLIAKDTGVHISFLGGGKGGMRMNFDHKGFEPNVVDAIRSWKTVEIDRNGKAKEAYRTSEGGYFGINKKDELDLSVAQAELNALLKKEKR